MTDDGSVSLVSPVKPLPASLLASCESSSRVPAPLGTMLSVARALATFLMSSSPNGMLPGDEPTAVVAVAVAAGKGCFLAEGDMGMGVGVGPLVRVGACGVASSSPEPRRDHVGEPLPFAGSPGRVLLGVV